MSDQVTGNVVENNTGAAIEVESTPEIEQAPPAPVDEEAALDQQIEEQAIDLPEGEKLVPLSALTALRDKYKVSKAEAARAKHLQAQLDQFQTRYDEEKPWIEAAKTIAATRQLQGEQPPPQVQQDPQHLHGLGELARALDLYKPDATLDLDKAQKIHDYQVGIARETAQQEVAPVRDHSVKQLASVMFSRAEQTVSDAGTQPDPAILKDVWGRLDPRFTATEDGAREAWVAALGRSAAIGKLVYKNGDGPAPRKQNLPPPVFTEKSGGQEFADLSPLSEGEKRAARDMGLTDKQYLESASKAPWLRRRR